MNLMVLLDEHHSDLGYNSEFKSFDCTMVEGN